MPAKATKAFLEWKRRTSPISAMSCGPSVEPTPNISMIMERTDYEETTGLWQITAYQILDDNAANELLDNRQ